MQSVIRFEHVSKRFLLHRTRSRSFQEMAVDLFHRKNQGKEAFWVLKDVNFTVEPGEVVGIIGPNGAGKSTILKLISRIIEPTAGQVSVQGRVGALLELGAGFHPDLTGRENIYLNGSLLGLSREEISHKLEAIIDFAELETFIDVPVKHYSSGMYVRLGFSVAVHTEPEILLVDEVLAVGDAAFQRKCLGKIAELRAVGCTVLFVSHSLQLTRQLCSRMLWLSGGTIRQAGSSDEVIKQYIAAVMNHSETDLAIQNASDMPDLGGEALRILAVTMVGTDGELRWAFHSGEPLSIHIKYEASQRVMNPVFSILIHRSDGIYVSSTNTYNIDPFKIGPIEGFGKIVVDIDHLDLYEGDYFLSVGAYLQPDPPYWTSPAAFLDKRHKFQMYSEQGPQGLVVLSAQWRRSLVL